jgi:hypothetical protein
MNFTALPAVPTPLRPTYPLRRLIAVLALLAATLAGATTVVPPDFAQLVNGSDYIVRARVATVASEKGRQGAKDVILTRVGLEIIEVIAGSPPSCPVLVLLGGRVGEEELWIEGAPQFAVGDEDILFVQGNGVNFSPLFALGHGRYSVRRDAAGREFLTRSNGVPLEDVAEVSAPLLDASAAALQLRFRSAARALSPSAFAAAIRSTRSTAPRHEN